MRRYHFWRRMVLGATAMAVVCLLGAASASGQLQPKLAPPNPPAAGPAAASPAQRTLMAEDVFKNVQVLKGIPVDEFMDTMGFFAASLSLNCTSCHGLESASDATKFADDTPLKQTARKMILMVRAINRDHFGGARLITCYSCHRGGEAPKVTPSLAEQYGAPLPEDPNEFVVPRNVTGGPSADRIFDKYIQALGGAQQLAGLTSFTAKGTYAGYDTDRDKYPVEIFAKAPDQRAMIVHITGGDKIATYDGRAGWVAEPATPAPLMELTGGDLDGAKMDAMLFFPAQVKQSRNQWRAGATTIDDADVEVLEGTSAGQTPVKLYFDKDSGLLVRVVRFSSTLVGQVTTQVDYSDYRAVNGIKMPFKWTTTWVDGQSTTELSEVQPNVPIDPARFAKPAAPRPGANR